LILALEQSVLDGCVCAYNISPTAGSSAGVKHTEQTKVKVSEGLKGNSNRKGCKTSEETKAKLSARMQGVGHPNHGRKRSDETKAKISAALKGAGNPNYGQNLSEESKAKMAASKYNTGKAVYLYLVHTDRFELTGSFPNATRCSETLGIPLTTLFRRIKNRTLIKVKGVPHIVSFDANLT
jgi:group I intron endonuclease